MMKKLTDSTDYYGLSNVIEICRSRINVAELVRTAQTNTLCVDGTSCTKKTSVLMSTGHRVTKVQQFHPCQNPDTYFPSMIGYICAGIMDNTNHAPHYNDRSPLNVLDWYILWNAMDKFLCRFGNVRIDTTKPDHCAFVDELIDIFNKYRTVYYRQMLNQSVTCIALVDSNIDRVDSLRYERAQGSDVQRSSWKFYTQIQNIMYITLYPDRHIDLAWFDDYSTNTVVHGIVCFLNDTLAQMANRPVSALTSFFPQCKLPSVRTDYTFNNAQVHVQRAVGRWSCKLLAANALPSMSSEITDALQSFKDYVPPYLQVDNVYNPITGEKLEPILPMSRLGLLSSDAIDNYASDDDYEDTTGYIDFDDNPDFSNGQVENMIDDLFEF